MGQNTKNVYLTVSGGSNILSKNIAQLLGQQLAEPIGTIWCNHHLISITDYYYLLEKVVYNYWNYPFGI